MDCSDVHTHCGVVCPSVNTHQLLGPMAHFEQMPLTNCLAVTPQVTGFWFCTNAYDMCVFTSILKRNCTLFYWPGWATGFFCQLHKGDKVEPGTGGNEQLLLQCYTWAGLGVGRASRRQWRGSERSRALWSPSLIEFPGTGLQYWGLIVEWELQICADLSQTQVG